MTQVYNIIDEYIVMVHVESDLLQFKLDEISEWSCRNNVDIEFISIHRGFIKYSIRDPQDRALFLISHHCSTKR